MYTIIIRPSIHFKGFILSFFENMPMLTFFYAQYIVYAARRFSHINTSTLTILYPYMSCPDLIFDYAIVVSKIVF